MNLRRRLALLALSCVPGVGCTTESTHPQTTPQAPMDHLPETPVLVAEIPADAHERPVRAVTNDEPDAASTPSPEAHPVSPAGVDAGSAPDAGVPVSAYQTGLQYNGSIGFERSVP